MCQLEQKLDEATQAIQKTERRIDELQDEYFQVELINGKPSAYIGKMLDEAQQQLKTQKDIRTRLYGQIDMAQAHRGDLVNDLSALEQYGQNTYSELFVG